MTLVVHFMEEGRRTAWKLIDNQWLPKMEAEVREANRPA
jgi:hypothetical protein